MTRRLAQSDVVVGETRWQPDGTRVDCLSASSTHVGYSYVDAPDWTPTHVIRRDIWCSWPVIDAEDT